MSITDRIRVRAYEIWQYCMDHHLCLICDHYGNIRHRTAQDDWLEAESYVLNEIEQENSRRRDM